MSRRTQTLPPDYFEALYTERSDPWNFASSDYERDKYSETLAALTKPRYANALEIGCSIGVLTYQLAARCERLLAVDAAATALSEARRRCAEVSNVAFQQMFAPREWPTGVFDLILLSEVVYYLEAADVARLAARVAASLSPRGTVLLVHWTGLTNYPISGDEAAELFIASSEQHVERVRSVRRPQYRLDVLVGR